MLIECPKCVLNFDLEPLQHYEVEGNDPPDTIEYSFFKCPKCYGPVLGQRYTYPHPSMTKEELLTVNVIYPGAEFHINPAIPYDLYKALVEAINCHKARTYTAACIMCRRTIDGFCAINDCNTGNLAKSLVKLKDKGIINDQLLEWANHLRFIGNEAAHNIRTDINASDARDALDFTIAILDFSYSFKNKFENFKQRISEMK